MYFKFALVPLNYCSLSVCLDWICIRRFVRLVFILFFFFFGFCCIFGGSRYLVYLVCTNRNCLRRRIQLSKLNCQCVGVWVRTSVKLCEAALTIIIIIHAHCMMCTQCHLPPSYAASCWPLEQPGAAYVTVRYAYARLCARLVNCVSHSK